MSEGEIAGQHRQCNEHELGQAPGDGEGQGGLTCCSPWSLRVGHDWEAEQQQQRGNIAQSTIVEKSWKQGELNLWQ